MKFPDFRFRATSSRQKEKRSDVSSPPSETSRPASTPPFTPSWSLAQSRYAFKSYKLQGEYQQPWITDKRLKRTRYSNYIIWGFIALGLCTCTFLAYDGFRQAKAGGDYCLIMEDDFESINPATWTHEVQTGGFGAGSFDWATADASNSYTDANGLHIVPTLTSETTKITEQQIFNDFTVNLTKTAEGDGTCTSPDYRQCSVHSNETIGTIIPPVRSARLSTKGKKSIKYGKVEVVAKFPRGDWLWPAIWMMPEEEKYGAWPASGEIDIAEMRGNNRKYPLGNDAISSTLHWGPIAKLDAYWKTYGIKFLRRTDFTKSFHTYGLIWTEDYLFTYLDSTLKQVFYMGFGKKETMWQRGYFDGATVNNIVLENPWKATGRANTPFDENFYLILNVAVGSQNGWFYDGQFDKPWVDGGPTAARDFYKAKDEWLPTWGEGIDRGMTVKSVKMWRQGSC